MTLSGTLNNNYKKNIYKERLLNLKSSKGSSQVPAG